MIDLFEDFLNDLWDSLPNLPFPISATGLPRPRQSQAKEDLTINGRTGECHHHLTPIRITRYTKPYINSKGEVLGRFKDVGLNRCLKCGADVELTVI